jgi:hypothetical protein
MLTHQLLPIEADLPDEKVTFLSIFRYCNSTEKTYMITGTITAVLAGVSFPFFLMFFGQITGLFTVKDKAGEKGFGIFVQFVIIGSVYWILSKLVII